jgi:hypothetical protein
VRGLCGTSVAPELEENMTGKIVALEQIEDAQCLVLRARCNPADLDLREIVARPGDGAERRRDLVFYPAPHFRRGCRELFW